MTNDDKALEEEMEGTNPLVLNDALYRRFKALVQIILPAFSTFYITVGNIWDWPNIERIVGTVTALTLFLGVIMGVSKRVYDKSGMKYDGTANVIRTEEGGVTYSLELNDDPWYLQDKKEVSLKVVK